MVKSQGEVKAPRQRQLPGAVADWIGVDVADSSRSPRRIQRKRTKGWKMPKGAIYVGRPTKWGNPCIVRGNFAYDEWGPDGGGGGHEHYCLPGEARGVAVRLFREALMDGRLPYDPADVNKELRGRDLVCWCPLDAPCHADVLLEVANRGDARG